MLLRALPIALASLLWTALAQAQAPDQRKPTAPGTVGSSCDNPADASEADAFFGRHVAVQGVVARVTHRPDVKGSPTWIELGEAFPSRRRTTLVIWGKKRPKFEALLAQPILGRTLCAVGNVTTHQGLPNMTLDAPSQLTLK